MKILVKPKSFTAFNLKQVYFISLTALFFAAPAVVATPKMKAAKSNKSFFISFYYI